MKDRTKAFFITLSLIFFMFSVILEVFAVPPHSPKHRPSKKSFSVKRRFIRVPPHPGRPASPGPKHIWTPRYKHPSGVYIGGFWRPPSKKGFVWVEGYWNEDGDWFFGYWRPVKVKKGYVWVPGYWGSTIWVEGYRRPAKKPGFIWTHGHFNKKGIWAKGHWKKP